MNVTVEKMSYDVSLSYDSFLTGKKKVQDGLNDIEKSFQDQSRAADESAVKTGRAVDKSGRSIQDSNRKSSMSYGLLTNRMRDMGDAGKNSFKLASTGAAAFLGVALSLDGARRMFVSTTDQLVRLGNMGDYLGMSARSVDGFAKSAEQMGASGEEAISMLNRMKQAQLNWRNGFGGDPDMRNTLLQIGTAGNQDILNQTDPGKMMLATARALNNIPRERAQVLAGQAGFSPSMQEAIFSPNYESNVARLTGNSGATEDAVKQARNVKNVMVELNQAVEGVGDSMVLAFGPDVVKGMQSMEQSINNNKSAILGFMRDGVYWTNQFTGALNGAENKLSHMLDVGKNFNWLTGFKNPVIDTKNNSTINQIEGGVSRAWHAVSDALFPSANASEVTPTIPGVTTQAAGNVNQNRLLDALMMTESGGNANARSKVGALGAFQFMEGTARDLGLRVDGQVDERLNPQKSRAAASIYMSQLLKRYNGNVTQALQAYNWGMGNMDAYIKTGKGSTGQDMPAETRQYAGKVAQYYGNMATVATPNPVNAGNTDNSQSSTTHIGSVTVLSQPESVDQLTQSVQQQASRGQVTVSFSGGNVG